MDRKKLGQWGERAACEYLQNAGCKIVGRNYRLRTGEIDIIAEENGVLAFVEVKTRSSAAFGTPGEAVGNRKQQKIAQTAALYLQCSGERQRQCRFDVVEIYKNQTQCRVHWIKNAFEIE